MSSFYRYLQCKGSGADSAEQELGKAVELSFQRSHRIYGRPRIFQNLKANGIRIGRTRLARLMKERAL